MVVLVLIPEGNIKSKSSAAASCSSVGGDTRRRRLVDVQESKVSCEDVCLLRFLQRRDFSRAFFYRTLNLKGLGGLQRRQRSQPLKSMKRENEIDGGVRVNDKATDSAAAAGGSKVLPLTDSNQSSRGNDNDQRPELAKNGKKRGDKMKGICRVKELLRWPAGASAKGGEKGERNSSVATKVFHYKNTTGLKEVAMEDQFVDDSPKISFRLDLERCSTTSSAYSAILKSSAVQIDILKSISLHVQSYQHADRTETWINTDSECK
ncbi:uncharacterized protein LOC105165855 [Sesamum indicum]|uniref:Uncharacterized protein LOC105165855 n=1 Tax=Sesamum indicum TaxID=4182 RepID=A0A6I9TH24_SESIN|nr:uncharacterized protein LOC105165855 [Sesamum indicum]